MLLIDYDNLQICASRDTPGLDLDLQAVMSLAQSFGTVIIARAYAEWNHLSERLATYKVGIEPAFAPVLRTESGRNGGGKSLADTVIVADGVDLLWRMSPDVFVLATSDKDMIPLVRLAKQRGSEVVVVGSDLTAVPLVEMANQFVTYRQLIGDREQDKERERLQERERMRVAHEARRDEAIRSRETRRVATRPERAVEEERTRALEAAAAIERQVVPGPAQAALALGEQALAAGAGEGTPTRRRRRRRPRARPAEGVEGVGLLPELAEGEEAQAPSDGQVQTSEAPRVDVSPRWSGDVEDTWRQGIAPATPEPAAEEAEARAEQVAVSSEALLAGSYSMDTEGADSTSDEEQMQPAPRPALRRRRPRTRKPPAPDAD